MRGNKINKILYVHFFFSKCIGKQLFLSLRYIKVKEEMLQFFRLAKKKSSLQTQRQATSHTHTQNSPVFSIIYAFFFHIRLARLTKFCCASKETHIEIFCANQELEKKTSNLQLSPQKCSCATTNGCTAS